MRTVRGVLSSVAVTALLGGAAFAQNMISAKSGLVHYLEGKVLLDGKAVESRYALFPQMKENSLLRTEAGRAEVLLSPGVFLRVAENSGVRLFSDRVTDTRLELVSGSVLLECAEILKGNKVTILRGDAAISLRQDGLYRVDSDPPELRVYRGEAVVESAGQIAVVKGGKALTLDGTLLARKFDAKTGDGFYRWSKRRAEYLAMANVSAARSVHSSGLDWRAGGWYWNRYFGMFTYIPLSGAWRSPFGWRYWSPQEVYAVYASPARSSAATATAWDRTPRHDANLGYSTISRTPAGTSGTVASSAPQASSGASPAPIPRGGSGSAGGRSR